MQITIIEKSTQQDKVSRDDSVETQKRSDAIQTSTNIDPNRDTDEEDRAAYTENRYAPNTL